MFIKHYIGKLDAKFSTMYDNEVAVCRDILSL